MLVRMQLPILWMLLIASGSAAAQTNVIRLASPNGQTVYTFRLDDTASYSVSFKNKPIITDGSISLSFLEMGEKEKKITS